MATHSSVLALRIPGMGEPGGLPSTGLHRVRHDWSDLAAAAKGYGNQYWPKYSSILAWRTPSLTEKLGRLQSTGSQSQPWLKWLCVHRHETFFACGSSAPKSVEASCLVCGDPGGTNCSGTWTATAAGVMALTESLFEPLEAGDQKASLASLSQCLHLFRHLEGSLIWGPSLLFGMTAT